VVPTERCPVSSGGSEPEGQSWRRAATRAAAWLGGALGDLRRGVLGDLRARLAPADALARTRLAETLAHQLTQTVE